MDSWANGHMDGRTDGRTDGWTDGQTYERTDRRRLSFPSALLLFFPSTILFSHRNLLKNSKNTLLLCAGKKEEKAKMKKAICGKNKNEGMVDKYVNPGVRRGEARGEKLEWGVMTLPPLWRVSRSIVPKGAYVKSAQALV